MIERVEGRGGEVTAGREYIHARRRRLYTHEFDTAPSTSSSGVGGQRTDRGEDAGRQGSGPRRRVRSCHLHPRRPLARAIYGQKLVVLNGVYVTTEGLGCIIYIYNINVCIICAHARTHARPQHLTRQNRPDRDL